MFNFIGKIMIYLGTELYIREYKVHINGPVMRLSYFFRYDGTFIVVCDDNIDATIYDIDGRKIGSTDVPIINFMKIVSLPRTKSWVKTFTLLTHKLLFELTKEL